MAYGSTYKWVYYGFDEGGSGDDGATGRTEQHSDTPRKHKRDALLHDIAGMMIFLLLGSFTQVHPSLFGSF